MTRSLLFALLLAPQTPSVDAVLDHRIGSSTGDIEEFFQRISDLAVDEEGNVYVLDERVDELRAFSPDGAYVRNLGRRGGGPFDLSRPSHVDVHDGIVTVLNPGGRTASFTRLGEQVEATTLPFGTLSARRLGANTYLGYVSEAISRGAAFPRESIILFEGTSVDTLLSAPSSDVLFQSPSATSLIRSQMCRLAYAELGENGEIWIASGIDGMLTEWVRESSTAHAGRTARVAPGGDPIPESVRAELLALLPSELDRTGAAITLPSTLSSVCGLERAGDVLWIRLRDVGDRQQWRAIDLATLRSTREFAAPSGVAMRAFSGERGYGTAVDGSGVLYVGIYRLE